MNVKVCRSKVENCIGNHELGSRNGKGDRFIQFCQENNTVISTILCHPNK